MRHARASYHDRSLNIPRERTYDDNRSGEPIRIRGLLSFFKPALPDRILPRDPRPNYKPMYMENNPNPEPARYSCHDCGNRYDSKSHLEAHRHSRHVVHAPPLRPDIRVRGVATASGDPVQAGKSSRTRVGHENATTQGAGTGAKCPHCDAVLAYAYNLSKHIENRHNIPTGKYHCRLCRFTGSSKESLIAHRESEHRRCPHCTVKFSTERGLNRHMYDCPSRGRSHAR